MLFISPLHQFVFRTAFVGHLEERPVDRGVTAIAAGCLVMHTAVVSGEPVSDHPLQRRIITETALEVDRCSALTAISLGNGTPADRLTVDHVPKHDEGFWQVQAVVPTEVE